MSSPSRVERVAEVIKHEIAVLIANGLKDPRVGFVSVMAVKMSKDLRYANVYVSLFGSEKEKRDSMVGLRRSSGWIRKAIGQKVRLYSTPEVRFFEDNTLDEVYHLEDVLREIKDVDPGAPEAEEEGASAPLEEDDAHGPAER